MGAPVKRDMHIGGELILFIRAVTETAVIAEPVEEEIFNPEAAKTDGNPFPEEQQTEEQPVEVVEPDYESMTVEELKALYERGLPVTGTKTELIARLTEADTPPKRQLKRRPSFPPKRPRHMRE